MSENKKINTLTIIILLIALSIGFGGGIYYQKTKTTNLIQNGQLRNFQGSNGQNIGPSGAGNGTNRNGARFNGITGEITSVDENSITVKMNDGSSKIVLFSDKTQVNKSAQASVADLKAGETVMVMGETGTDGSVTAQSIQLNPINRINSPVEQKK
jgi:threonine dehydrogenase-like Zn-dependent dehydrogenase